MTFTYFKKTGEFNRRTQDEDEWDGDDGDEFDYKPKEKRLIQELKRIVVDDYGYRAWDLVSDFELYDEVAEYYRENLHDVFEEEAMESEE